MYTVLRRQYSTPNTHTNRHTSVNESFTTFLTVISSYFIPFCRTFCFKSTIQVCNKIKIRIHLKYCTLTPLNIDYFRTLFIAWFSEISCKIIWAKDVDMTLEIIWFQWTQFYCLSERLLGRFVFMVVWGCSDHRNTKQYKKVPILDLSSTCVLCKTKQSISVKIGNGQYAVFRATYLEKKVIL